MTDIFDMEDEVSTLTSQLHTKIVISPAGAGVTAGATAPSSSTQELNYKLIDAIDEETIANEKKKKKKKRMIMMMKMMTIYHKGINHKYLLDL